MRCPPTTAAALRALCIATLVLAAGSAAPARAEAPADAAVERDRRLLETYRQMLAEDPYQEYALRRLLEVSHSVGGLKGLTDLYREATETRPRDHAAWVVLGHLHRAADRDSDALAAYGSASKLKPKDPGPHLAVARLHRRAERWDEALAAFDVALPLTRDRARKQENLKSAAETALSAGRLPAALAYLDTLVETEPGNVFLRMDRAATLGRAGEHQAALDAWLEVRARVGKRLKHLVIIWRQIAETQEQLGELAAAEATWREALDQTPRGHWARASFLEGLVGVHRRRDTLPQLIEELLPDVARSNETRIVVARLYEEIGDDHRALEQFEAAVKARSSDIASRLRMISILERIGRTDDVIAAYRALVKASPGDPRHELRLAEILFGRGKRKEGFKILTRLSRRYGQDPGVHQSIIDLTMRYGDDTERKRIETEYKILMRLEPKEESHVISLGEYYWTSDDKDRAIATWVKLRQLGRSRGEGHLLLAEVFADHRLDPQAEVEFEAALAAEPGNVRFAKAYALWLEKHKQHARALELWRQVLKGEGKAGHSVRSRGAAVEARRRITALWERTGLLGREIARLERAFGATPPDLDAGHFLAEAYLRGRRLDDALRVLERLHEADPKSVDALAGLETVYTRQNRLRDAITVLEKLAGLNPRAAYEYFHRAADLALALGDDALALEYTRQVVSLNPADPGAHARVGDLFLRMGRLAEAAEAWRQTLALDPRNYPIRFKLASLYRDLGQPLREEHVLLEIVRESPDPADVLKAGRRLLQVAQAGNRLASVEEALRPLVVHPGARHDVYLKLIVDLYSALAREIRWSEARAEDRDTRLLALGERALKPLLDALTGSDVALRARALEVLRWTRPPGAVPALSRLALGPDTLVRFRAALALGRIGSRSAVEALGRLAASPTSDGREVAVWALGLAAADDADRLLVPFASAGNPRFRMLTAIALGHRGGVAGLNTAEILTRDSDARLRLAALWAVARIASPRSVPVLVAALDAEDARAVRLAAWGLGRVGTREALAALAARLWRAGFLAPGALADGLLSHGQRDASDAAIEAAYAAFADPSAGRLNVELAPLLGLARSPSPGRDAASHVLGRDDAVRPLVAARIAALFSGEERDGLAVLLRRWSTAPADGLTLWPLAERDDPRAAALLTPHLADLLAAASGQRGHSNHGPALEVASRLHRLGVAGLDAEALRQHALDAVRMPGVRLRAAAAAALGRVAGPDDREAVDALAVALDTGAPGADDGRLRRAIARAFGRFDAAAAAPVLERLLRDESAEVRIAAVTSAAGTGSPALIGAVADLLDDLVPEVALAAVDALAAMDLPAARAALERAASSGEPLVERRARMALRPASDGASEAPGTP